MDPYRTYEQLRDEAPVFHDERRDLWVLSRYEDVQRASRDWSTFSSRKGVHVGEFDRLFGSDALLSTDPPKHNTLREIVKKRFTPRAVQAFVEAVRTIASRHVDGLRGSEFVDLARDFGWAIPPEVSAHVLGVPQEDLPYLREILNKLAQSDPSTGDAEVGYLIEATMAAAFEELEAYFAEQVRQRMSVPRDDVLSDIAAAEQQRMLEPHARGGLCLLLFLAGIDTTSSLISNSLWHLANRKTDRDLLREMPRRSRTR